MHFGGNRHWVPLNKSRNGNPQSLQKVFLIFFSKNLNKQLYFKDKVPCT